MRGNPEQRETEHDDEEDQDHDEDEAQRDVDEPDKDADVAIHMPCSPVRRIWLRAMNPVMIAIKTTVSPPTSGITWAKNDSTAVARLMMARLFVCVPAGV